MARVTHCGPVPKLNLYVLSIPCVPVGITGPAFSRADTLAKGAMYGKKLRGKQMIRAAMILVFLAVAAHGQERKPSHCIAVARDTPGIEYIQKASYRDPVPDASVRLHFVAHASFLIRAADGLSVITDFTGFIGNVEFLPDVVTMNHAHSTHWTAHPDPAIPHVLPGWGATFGEGVEHYLDLDSMVIRNVPTDIRSAMGEGVEPRGNSLFVFQVAGLCIGHLGHLHHEPSAEQYAALGRIDVVMAPVDGGYTLPLDDMIRVLKRLKSSIVIPMHWFDDGSLGRFIAGIESEFTVVETGSSRLTVSLDNLPAQPTVMILRPAYLTEED